jgi:uncharacterized membrane protein
MSGGFILIVGLALAAVLATLVLGLVSLAKGGEFSKKYGNKLMRARIVLQLVAVGLLIIGALIWRR